ncbi:MAG: SGNH/GDSL hydrolase family protein [Leadbetterella sp.]|nr:SGNH/GDSL hydrolase family protein [Leadbetterella sp.]
MRLSLLKIILINLFILEGLSFMLVRCFYLATPPQVYKQQFIPYFIDTEARFTTWHLPDTSTRQIGPRWNVKYRFNSAGARDKERQQKSSKTRFLFLGDSFMEGYGVKQKDRLSDIVEKETQTESLNFSVSGLAQTQMRLLYTDLAAGYDHQVLFLTLYPYNDFREMNYENRQKFFGDRHKPYTVKDSSGNFRTVYYLKDARESAYHISKFTRITARNLVSSIVRSDLPLPEKGWSVFRNFSYTGSLLDTAVERIRQRLAPAENGSSGFDPGNHHLQSPGEDQWEILAYELKQIREQAGSRPVILMLIPHPDDFAYIRALGGKSPVQEKMEEIAGGMGIHFVDFLAKMPAENVKKLYHRNDDHWNKKGHSVAAKILVKELENLGLLP